MNDLEIAKRTKKGKKEKAKDTDLEELNIRYHDFHPEWSWDNNFADEFYPH